MNLMLNGIEAMKETGGELTVKSQLDQDGQLMISVSDAGVGLPAENVGANLRHVLYYQAAGLRHGASNQSLHY